MGRQIAEHNWSGHPVGAIGCWPAAFRTSLGMVLNSGFPSYVIWGAGQFVFYNDAYLPILGNKAELGQGRSLTELYPEIKDEACAIADRALAGESTFFQDRPFVLDRGGEPEQTYFTFSYSPIRDEFGLVVGVLGTVVETTDKVVALARHTDSEQRLQMSLDASGTIGTFFYDPESNIAVVDERFARLFQVEAALAQSGTELERFTNMIHPEDRARVMAAIGHSIATKTLYEIEYRIPQLNGKVIWVGARGGMFVDARTGRKRFAGVATDITERRLAEEELRKNATRQAFQLSLTDSIRDLTAPDEIIATVSALLGAHLDVARVLYAEVSDDGERAFVRRDWTRDGFASMAGQVRVLDDFGPAMAADLRAGRVVVNNDVEADPRTMHHVAAYRSIGVQADLLVPLAKAGRLRVVLTVHSAEPHRWSGEEIQLTQEVAERTWLALEAARAQSELRSERDLSQSIFESMAEGFALLDREWTLLQVNAVGAQLAQRPMSAMAGRNLWQAMPELVGSEVEALYRRVQQSALPGTLEFFHQMPQGRAAWIELRAYPVPGERLAIFCRDISRRKKNEEELNDANRRKDEFLAMLAHELRNPLAPIRAAADLLSMPNIDADHIKRTSGVITRQVKHMTGLVDDLLDVSRVTRGQVELALTELDAKRIVADAVEQVRPLIEGRRHHLAVHLAPQAAHVLGDQKRLVQVITNLLNNAAKYTPEGGNIGVRMAVQDQHVVFTVTDDGIGMSPDTLERAFELFAQAERTSDRAQGGLGLGLALVKSLAELHFGSVSASSAGAGAGSEVTVRLPRIDTVADQPDQALAASAASADAVRALRLMIVDDNVDAASMLCMFLEAAGHSVCVEYSSQAALARAQVEQIDVCLLDIGLPDMDGNELARRLRSHSACSNAVLIAVTGYGQDLDRANSAAAGFDDHFVKPLDTHKLLVLLDKLHAH